MFVAGRRRRTVGVGSRKALRPTYRTKNELYQNFSSTKQYGNYVNIFCCPGKLFCLTAWYLYWELRPT